MPLFVEVVSDKPGREVFGPFAEQELLDALALARIGSARGDHPREVVWSCRGRQPMRIRTYVDGEKLEDQSDPGFDRLRECIERSAGACRGAGERPPARARIGPLPERLTCPAGGEARSIEGLRQAPRRSARGAALAAGSLALGWGLGALLKRPAR